MSEVDPADIQKWLQRQMEEYEHLFPLYQGYADYLESALREAAYHHAPLAIIQTRPKGVASFSRKALLKRHKYDYPAHQFTDLCGARIIARTRGEVEALCEFVKDRFVIDWDNSLDAKQRLEPSEFGYRSIHYIVSLDPDGDVPADARRLLGFHCARDGSWHPLKAEIQVRTIVEHAWADFAHDLSYKGAFDLPVEWKREIAVIAAELEDVDHAFQRVEEGLRTYAASYGSYLTAEQIHQRMAELDLVLSLDRSNESVAWQVGKLAISIGDWDRAVAALDPVVDREHPETAYQPALRDLGVALCKRHHDDRTGSDYRRGQRYLELASDERHHDPDALSSLAGTWRDLDDEKAKGLYRRAFELDPTDFYPLGNYLEYEIAAGDLGVLDVIGPLADRAIERCRAQIAVGVNFPWALYGMGKLQLLTGAPYEALMSYARAVQTSTAPFMISGAINGLASLAGAGGRLPGLSWAQALLTLGLASRFSGAATDSLAGQRRAELGGPVVVVVGGTDPRLEDEMQAYRELLVQAFADFKGTVMCGGTRQGISGLVGEIAASAPDRITAVSYLPAELPDDAGMDERYGLIVRTEGDTFTPLQPLQGWIDIVASGIDPRSVLVIGINGGHIAAAEYRIALALGATVVVVQDSGRAAARLLADQQWAAAEHLVATPPDPQTLRAFVSRGNHPIGSEIRERIGRAVHDSYLAERSAEDEEVDPSRAPWDRLDPSLRESNRDQADHIAIKLHSIGYEAVPSVDTPEPFEFTIDEVEVLAEMEHGRWCAERLTNGWTWATTKNVASKQTPYLVAWTNLPEDIKERDRQVVRNIPSLLAREGLSARRAR